MSSSPDDDRPWVFGDFVVEPAQARLLRGGVAVETTPRPLALLVVLLRRAGELVDKERLLDEVWGTEHITEGVIKTAVSELRTWLGDDARAPRWLETVPRRGYRFVGEVRRLAREAASVPPQGAAPPTGNLPAWLAPLVGRDDELAALAGLLQRQPLVTVVGPGGVGKTVLALAAAQGLAELSDAADLQDGRWWVELAPLPAEATDTAALCAAIAQTLNLGDAAAREPAALVRALRPRRALLLLDNAEHLIGPVAALVQALVAGAPGLRLLVTSQLPLALGAEQVFGLAPLAVPPPGLAAGADADTLQQVPAVQLFVRRVAERLPGFVLSERHAPAVRAVCQALDGLPLSLELAAARVPLLGVHGLAERLGAGDDAAQLQWVKAVSRSAPARQHSLERTVAWSCVLLSPPQRRLLMRLAVFRGGVTLGGALAAALAVDATDEAEAAEWLQALVERSLLLPAAAADDGPPRYRMLEGVREYALRELEATGARAEAQALLLQASLAHWRRADAEAWGTPTLVWIAEHQPELNNLRAALRQVFSSDSPSAADAGHALELLGHTGNAWHRLGAQPEGRRWFEQAWPLWQVQPDPVCRARFAAAWGMQSAVSHLLQAGPVLAQLLPAAEALLEAGDARGAALAAHAAFHLGERHAQPALRDAALALQARCSDPAWGELGLRALRLNRAYARREHEGPAAYEAAMRHELALARRLDAVAEGWVASQGLMLALLDQGRHGEAVALVEPVLAEVRRHGLLARYPALVGVWLTALGTLGEPPRLRAALGGEAGLAGALEGSGAGFMLQLPGALLAEGEGRLHDAARLLGCYGRVHPLQPPGAAGSGLQDFARRTQQGLHQRLGAALGPAALATALADGAALSDDEAGALLLAGAWALADRSLTAG